PGDEGSLSYYVDIALDGVQPHITSIVFGGDYNATYYGGDIVRIFVEFSAPVVVMGSPSLLLETGKIDRKAEWVNTSSLELAENTTLLFEYTVVTGDETTDLDYWGNNEARDDIRRFSGNPTLSADVHLNPTEGYLSGTDRATVFGGWAYFRDLFVRTRGRGYKMFFEAEPSHMNMTIKVSTTFEVRPSDCEDSDHSDMFGRSISLDGDILLAGAPKKHLITPEIQLVT
ncbi:unnamed protein product, partial [Discosporangium mesarthrocarpum]